MSTFVVITGKPGSGKTSLSKRLSSKRKQPLFTKTKLLTALSIPSIQGVDERLLLPLYTTLFQALCYHIEQKNSCLLSFLNHPTHPLGKKRYECFQRAIKQGMQVFYVDLWADDNLLKYRLENRKYTETDYQSVASSALIEKGSFYNPLLDMQGGYKKGISFLRFNTQTGNFSEEFLLEKDQREGERLKRQLLEAKEEEDKHFKKNVP